MKKCLFLIVALLVISCQKVDKSDLPYARVNFKVDLRNQDRDLVGTLNYKTFTQPRLAAEYVGYSGILVVCGFDNIYYAYELCCPHEAQKSIKVVADTDGTATCPGCQTVYDTGYGIGNPMSGPSQHRLRRLNIIQTGQDLIIQY